MYKIEKNVPLPTSRGKWRQLHDQMEEGDSVVVKSHSEAKGLVVSIKQIGGKAVSRPVENGWRVWLRKKSNK